MKMSPDITDRLLSCLPESGAVLDIGCGRGELLRALSGRGCRLWGVDPSFRNGVPGLPEGITLLAGTAEDIPLPGESVDAAVAQCVFSLCQPERAAEEMHRVIKKGGLLILSDLFSDTAPGRAADSPLLGNIYLRERLEAYFSGRFQKVRFFDETRAMTGMLMQAIMDGEGARCVSPADLKMLKALKARYGVWVWKKEQEDAQ